MNRGSGLVGSLVFVTSAAGIACTADEAQLIGGRQDEVGAAQDASADREAAVHEASLPEAALTDVRPRDVGSDKALEASASDAHEAGAADAHDAAIDAAREACDRAASGEICNGVDDDCDGVADEGCPDGVLLSTGRDGVLLGRSVGGGYSSSYCGDGNVLVGYHIWTSGYTVGLNDECAPVSLKVDTGTVPYEYSLAIQSPTNLQTWGLTSNATDQPTICPENYAVTGLSITLPGQAGYDVLSSMSVQCTKLAIVPSAGGYVVQPADTITLPAAKGSIYRASDSSESDSAPPGHLAITTNCAAGAWIDRIGFSDAVVTIHTK